MSSGEGLVLLSLFLDFSQLRELLSEGVTDENKELLDVSKHQVYKGLSDKGLDLVQFSSIVFSFLDSYKKYATAPPPPAVHDTNNYCYTLKFSH